MKINLNGIKIEYDKGNIFIFLDDISFIFRVIGVNKKTLVSKKDVYLNIGYKVTDGERKEIKEQLIQIASGIMNVIEMAGG